MIMLSSLAVLTVCLASACEVQEHTWPGLEDAAHITRQSIAALSRLSSQEAQLSQQPRLVVCLHAIFTCLRCLYMLQCYRCQRIACMCISIMSE